jgi:hypothetical protein
LVSTEHKVFSIGPEVYLMVKGATRLTKGTPDSGKAIAVRTVVVLSNAKETTVLFGANVELVLVQLTQKRGQPY